MQAFLNDEAIKQKYVERVKVHQKADEIEKGFYWEDGKGCAVGCTIEGSEHDRYETELGIPSQIAHIEDSLFEALPNSKAKEFPLKFLEAIPVGADLSLVTAKLMIWQFEDKKYGIKNLDIYKDDSKLLKVCEDVVAAYKSILIGEKVEDTIWEEIYSRAQKGKARAWAGAWARGMGKGHGQISIASMANTLSLPLKNYWNYLMRRSSYE